nr:hypothetical protein [Parabacteroides goldsteinii]
MRPFIERFAFSWDCRYRLSRKYDKQVEIPTNKYNRRQPPTMADCAFLAGRIFTM